MANEVALGASMRANLLSLQKTNSLLDATQLKLSTGRKINSALDGAQSFFTAQSLTNRATDLGRLLDSMGQSIQTIKEADKGVSALTNLVEQADAIATQAKDAIAGADGGTMTSAAVGANAATVTLETAGFVTLADNDDVVTFQYSVNGTDSTALNITEATTIQDLVDHVNGQTGEAAGVTASYDAATGQFTLTSDETVQNLTVSFAADAGNTGNATVAFGFNGAADETLAAGAAATDVSVDYLDVSTLEADYNEIRSQIDALVKDASYRGVNLLAGDDLVTVFNEDSSSSLTTKGVDFSASGLGLAAADFSSLASATQAIDDTKAALDEVRTFGSAIANSLSIIQTREDFTKETMNILEEGADKLTLADPNEEGARMLALQTRLQLSVTSLSLSAQSQQSVLSLF